ncbi:MAG: ATP-binding protein [Azospirillaceae bacterium]|nr:ATP-binding protein [Azospirillaceae bacterium]
MAAVTTSEIYGELQRIYMTAEAESTLEDVAVLGRLMAVIGVPIDSIVEIHGNIVAEFLGTRRSAALVRQIGAASTCLTELMVSWQIASENLTGPETSDMSFDGGIGRRPSFAQFLAGGVLKADTDEAALLRALGGGRDNLTLYRWIDDVMGHDRAEEVRQAVEQRRLIAIEFVVPETNAHYRIVVCTFREGRGIVGVRDVTTRFLAREAEFQHRKLESLGQLAGSMAHEFNNLLQPIVTLAQLTIEDHAGDPDLSADLKVILDCALRAAEIVRGAMLFVRGGGKPNLSRFSLYEAVVGELAGVRKTLPPGLTLVLQPDTGADDQVIGNRSELGEILRNLIGNAGDAVSGQGIITINLGECTLTGGEATRFQLPIGHYRRLAIIDQGVGIGKSQLDRIFEPFFTTKGIGRGTGLGLPIVRGIVRSWGGGIAVRSVSRLGSTFEIVLPPAGRAPIPGRSGEEY